MELNPVGVMDSVDALDLLTRTLAVLRRQRVRDEDLIRDVVEQKLRHQRALVAFIGDEPVREKYDESMGRGGDKDGRRKGSTPGAANRTGKVRRTPRKASRGTKRGAAGAARVRRRGKKK